MEGLRLIEGSRVSAEKVIATHLLTQRKSRPPDHAAESRALLAVAQELAEPRRGVLHKLTDAAMVLCRAQSAGVSILEHDAGRPVFRWHAISGQWAHFEGGTMPRDDSPCGVVVDENRPKLMVRPERLFQELVDVEPRIEEVLLIPFVYLGEPVGTVWILSHDPATHFDAEDCRLMGSLAAFAAAAFVLRESLESVIEASQRMSEMNRWLSEGKPVRPGNGEDGR